MTLLSSFILLLFRDHGRQDLIRLDDKIHLEFGTSKVQWEELERILNDLEMVKSLEEAKSRYVA